MCKIMEEIRDKSYSAGEAKKARDMAIAMAEKGWDVNQIAEIAKYDLKTVENWIQESSTPAER